VQRFFAMRILSPQRRAALLDRLTPHSLRAQFAVALSAMGLLIVAGGATAVYALHATGNAARQFSEEQIERVQNTQDLQQRTLQIQLLAERMVAADSQVVARQTYAQILSELDALDQLTARLAVGEDVSVLDLHQSSQLFRNSAHVLAQLRDAAARPGPVDVSRSTALEGYREEMQAHAQAMAQSAREQSDHLARAYQAAVLRVVDASRTSAYWVVAWLAFSLLAAWLIARVFLGQHVIARLQQVSRSLLAVDDRSDSQPRVPVHGDDEIGAMARAVERFLSDRCQLAATRALLEAEQQRLAAIIDNTADSIVVLQGGLVLQLNRAAERMFGTPNAQAAGQPGDVLMADFDWNPGDVPGIPRDAFAHSRDGRTIPVEVSLNPVASGTGSLVVLVIRDATLRREAEQHLIAARDAAEAARATQAIFLANISHELRTPLNGILGFAQLLRRDKPLTERQARGLKIIEESGQHLLMLINDILDLARIDEAKLELYPTEVNLLAFLQVVCDIIRVKAQEKSLMFVYEAAPDLPATVFIDEKRLRQVLLNLLSNAIKFSDTGRVTLRATPVPPPVVGAAAGLRFDVEDKGIGMNEAQLARLFQPFEQVAELRRREGGAGLGLTISRQLVRLMGGDIQVHSRQGQGSVFSFEIEAPTLQAQVHALPASGAPIGYKGQRRKILVVDDVPQDRAMLLDAVGTLGFEVEDACNGEEALTVAARFRPDLIVMDLMMPVMDGYEATRRLRLSPEGAEVRIIVMSASATAEAEACSREAGANALIGKPVEQSTLLNTIAAMLRLTWVREEPARAPEEALQRVTKQPSIVGAGSGKPTEPPTSLDAGGLAIGRAARHPTRSVRGDETLLGHRALLSGARVLLVEDNAINRELALEMLSTAGIVVSVACDGQEALDMLDRQRFDVVLMDCQMPVMDGYAATRALRQRPQLRCLPVIALTANAMVGDRDKALAMGMNDHIAKPIKLDELLATLARWVRPAGATVAESIGVANAGADVAPLAELPGIDTRAGLAGTTGNDTLYRDLLCSFRDHERAFLARFSAARATGDAVAATRLAHDLQSVAGALGVHAVQQAATALERACNHDAGDEEIGALAQNVARLLEPVIARLEVLGTECGP
jgi:PAS domain S-box-containing protein